MPEIQSFCKKVTTAIRSVFVKNRRTRDSNPQAVTRDGFQDRWITIILVLQKSLSNIALCSLVCKIEKQSLLSFPTEMFFNALQNHLLWQGEIFIAKFAGQRKSAHII